MKERFISLSMEDRLLEPVSGRSVLNSLTNFMVLYTTHLAPKGHTIKKIYHMYDPGWELDDGKLCAELFFDTVCGNAEVTFTVPCYFREESSHMDIHYEVSINGKHNVELGSEVVCLTLDKEDCDAQQWADELEKNLSQSVRPRSTLNPDLKIRPSKFLKGYRILLDPLAWCNEDEQFDTANRAIIACSGNCDHLWVTENIYKEEEDEELPAGFFSKRVGQRIIPYTAEMHKKLDLLDGLRSKEAPGMYFFVTEEPWKDQNESFIWWGEDEV